MIATKVNKQPPNPTTSTKTDSPLDAGIMGNEQLRRQKIEQQAVELFEDEAEAQRWLDTPKEVLNGQTPLDIISTDEGFQKVEELLYRAAYGVFG